MKKKYIAWSIALILGLALSACGGAAGNTASSSAPSVTSVDSASSESSAAKAEAEVEETEEERETVEEKAEEKETVDDVSAESTENTTPESTDETADPANEDLSGTYWVCTGISMGGELMDDETMELFEITRKDLAQKFLLRFNTDPTVTWMMEDVNFDEEGNKTTGMIGETVSYEKSESGISMTMMEEEIFLEYQGANLYFGSEEADMGYLLGRVDEVPDAFAQNPEIAFHISFTEEETIAMSAFMNQGLYLLEGETLYGRFFGEDSRKPGLAKVSWTIHESGNGFTMEDPISLEAECVAYYLTRYEDWIYYKRTENGTGDSTLCRIRDDGTDKEVLYEENCDYVSAHDGRIWFTNADYYFCSMAPDGSDVRVEYSENDIYYPYFVEGDWFLCQVDADQESLHLINITTGEDRKLNDERSYSPIIIGSDIFYYYKNTGEDTNYLAKLNPETLEIEHSENVLAYGFASEGEEIHIACEIGYLYSKPVAEFKDLSSNVEPGEDYNYIHYVTQDYLVEYEITDGATKANMYLYYRSTGNTLPRVPGA